MNKQKNYIPGLNVGTLAQPHKEVAQKFPINEEIKNIICLQNLNDNVTELVILNKNKK